MISIYFGNAVGTLCVPHSKMENEWGGGWKGK